MIPVLSIAQLREADSATITTQKLSSADLMERAAQACCTWLQEQLPAGTGFLIVCGTGNNGGDGLAIARILWKAGKEVRVVLVEESTKGTPDFTLNLQRWQALQGSETLRYGIKGDLPAAKENTVLIDALFGTGLNRAPSGIFEECIREMNESGQRIIAVDMPSGLLADSESRHTEAIVRATATLSFQLPKEAFFYPEYERFTGEVQLLDIGLDNGYLSTANAGAKVPSDEDIALTLPVRPRFAHKGTFGHALLLAGSHGKAGAATLAAGACLRSGVGLLSVQTPALCVQVLQSSVPEAMCIPDEGPAYIGQTANPLPFTAIGIGPGIGTDKQTGNVLKRLIQDADMPMVIDADALNLLAENPTWLNFLPAGCILTPHPGEFARLAGKIADSFERRKKQLELSARYNCYILLKGKYSGLSAPDGQYFFNPTGNQGMAKGGSGDVLTGLITGLLAQGLSPLKAALAGMYIHGLAGDLCAAEKGLIAMKSGDLIDYFPAAFREMEKYGYSYR